MSPTSRRVRQRNVDTNSDGATTDSEVGRKKAKTRDFHANIRCSIETYNQTVQQLNTQQKHWVVQIGFGEMLNIPLLKLDRCFCYWLMSRFDPQNRTLLLRENEKGLRVTDNHVGWILRIPNNSSTQLPPSNGSNLHALRNHYGGNRNITSKDIASFVVNTKSKWEFLRHFLLFTLGVFLCPTQNPIVSPKLFHAVVNIEQVMDYNWAAFVLEWLVWAAKRFKKAVDRKGHSSGMGGCIIILVLLYLDHIDMGNPVRWGVSPRLSAWNNEDMHKAIALDRDGRRNYGHAAVFLEIKYGEPHPLETLCGSWEGRRLERRIALLEQLGIRSDAFDGIEASTDVQPSDVEIQNKSDADNTEGRAAVDADPILNEVVVQSDISESHDAPRDQIRDGVLSGSPTHDGPRAQIPDGVLSGSPTHEMDNLCTFGDHFLGGSSNAKPCVGQPSLKEELTFTNVTTSAAASTGRKRSIRGKLSDVDVVQPRFVRTKYGDDFNRHFLQWLREARNLPSRFVIPE